MAWHLCIKDNQYDGKSAYITGRHYDLIGTPPASFFTADPLYASSQTTSVGGGLAVDLDGNLVTEGNITAGGDTITKSDGETIIQAEADTVSTAEQAASDAVSTAEQEAIDKTGGEFFTRTVDDELINSANSVDISIPSWAKKVEINIDGKSGQSGADNTVNLRVNGDATSSYIKQTLFASDSTPSASLGTASTSVPTLKLKQSSLDSNSQRVLLCPKNNGIKKTLFLERFTTTTSRFLVNEAVEWGNTVDDITTINIYTADSTNVSCVITARAWE